MDAIRYDLLLKLDLQWFAAEDEGRTEEPTEQKIKKARVEEGRVIKSQDLIASLGLLLPSIGILILAPSMLRTFTEMLRFFLSRSVEFDPSHDGVIYIFVLRYFAKLSLPILAIAIVSALASNIAQVGLLWTTKPMGFKFSRIIPNFASFFARMFSSVGVFNLFKSLIKIVIIGAVAFILIKGDIQKLANLQTANVYLSFTTISWIAIKMLIFTAILLLILSIPDYMFQRSQIMEQLKMTKQEIKEEHKQEEGDPEIKQRLRQRMRELLTSKINETVPSADVVITNPTHYAVAVKFDKATNNTPYVIMKGEDEAAQRIKAVARQNDIPTYEYIWLARALYAEVQIGEAIPEKYWTIIAEIIRRVKTLDEINRMMM